MPRSLRSQKQQTRLSFQPLVSSSPSKQGYSNAVRSRLAKVRFQGPQTRKKVGIESDENGSSSLPSPEPSSQILGIDQTSSSPLSDPVTSPALPNLPPSKVSVARADSGDDDNEEDEEDEIPIPSSKRRRLSERLNTSHIHNGSSPRRSQRLTQHTSPLSQRTRRSDHMQATLQSRNLTNPPTNDFSSPLRGFSNIGSAETSGDEEDVIVTKPIKRRSATKSTTEDPFIVADDDVTYMSSEEDRVPRKRVERSSRRNRDVFIVPNDEIEYETSDDENKQGMRTVGVPRKKSKARNQKSAREQAELEEELLDLKDSDSDDDNLGRTRGGPVNTQREKSKEHFERLKRQRAGERVTRILDSDEEEDYQDEEDEQNFVDIDTIGNDNDHIVITSDSSPQHSLIGAPDSRNDLSTEEYQEENEDDFVVEDVDTNVGRHGRPHPDMPLQFTSFASSKPRELFIHIVEWMVKNKISPAFSRDDDVFTMSFSRIDDQVKAQAGSRLISSAWGTTFKYAILARPGMTVHALPGLDEDNIRTCDACNRTNHPARYDFIFEGQAYNKDSLEPIDDDDDDDDSDDSQEEHRQASKVEYDEQGHVLAPPSQHFYLGRFCAANAEMGHKLSHWKYHLNEQVLIYLEEQGVLSPETIVARERLNKKKREKEAEIIVDMMEATGEVAKLWQGFQDDLEDARFGMEDHHGRNRGGRSKARIGSVRVERADGRIGEYGEGGKYKELARNESDSEGG